MKATVPTASPMTVPAAASHLRLTLHQMTLMLRRRQELAEKLVRSSGRRLILPVDMPLFERAAREYLGRTS